MASDLIDILVRINVAGGLAVLAVLGLRRAMRALAGARMAYGLWLAVPLIAAAAFLPARTVVYPGQVVTEYFAPVDPVVSVSLQAAAEPPAFDGAQILAVLWAIGAAASLGSVLWRHRQFVRELGATRGREDGILQAEHSTLGPAVVGVFNPKIVLPADFEARFGPSEQSVIIAHEARHVAAGHVQLNAMVVLVQCLSWFNPLAHIGIHFIRIDQELACDEAVVGSRPDLKRSYAEAMLKTQFAEMKLALGCYWPSRSKHPLTERIAMLKRENPSRLRRLAGVAGFSVLVLGGSVAAWAAQPPTVVPAPEATRALARPATAAIPAQPAAPRAAAIAATPARRTAPAAEATSALPDYFAPTASRTAPALEATRAVGATTAPRAETAQVARAAAAPAPTSREGRMIADPERPNTYVTPSSRGLRPAPDGHFYYSLPPLALNMRSESGQPDKYMKLTVTLELDEANAAVVERYAPRIMDQLHTRMQGVSAEMLQRSGAATLVRGVVEASVERTMQGRKVEGVLIEELLVTH